MKNTLYLLAAGVGFACIAWAFWHSNGQDAFAALPTLALIVTVADNMRLRRLLRARKIS